MPEVAKFTGRADFIQGRRNERLLQGLAVMSHDSDGQT